ncbi:MAG: peroxiredoxin [Armatimonadota bacterium]
MSAEAVVGGIPRIGDPVPEFEAITTKGLLKSSDLKGKWTVLFSHPADFTPVCTTEFVAFAQRADEFAKRGVQLIGLSIDSIHSHLAWLRNIKEKLGVKVEFPVIADQDMKVARKFGMIHPAEGATATVRAVFIIDDKAVIRALVYYPMSNGRNIDEILRLIDAIQTSDAYGVATPANWRPGDKVIVPPPKTMDEVQERLTGDYEEKIDFYLVKKSVPTA